MSPQIPPSDLPNRQLKFVWRVVQDRKQMDLDGLPLWSIWQSSTSAWIFLTYSRFKCRESDTIQVKIHTISLLPKHKFDNRISFYHMDRSRFSLAASKPEIRHSLIILWLFLHPCPPWYHEIEMEWYWCLWFDTKALTRRHDSISFHHHGLALGHNLDTNQQNKTISMLQCDQKLLWPLALLSSIVIMRNITWFLISSQTEYIRHAHKKWGSGLHSFLVWRCSEIMPHMIIHEKIQKFLVTCTVGLPPIYRHESLLEGADDNPITLLLFMYCSIWSRSIISKLGQLLFCWRI